MIKLTTKKTGYLLVVTAKLSKEDYLQEQELGAINQLKMPGLFQVKQISRGLLQSKSGKAKKVILEGPADISLTDKLKTPITKRDFFFIVENIVNLTRVLKNAQVPWNRVYWNTDGIFLNETTKELLLIPLPLGNGSRNLKPNDFLESLAYMAKPEKQEQNGISDFVYFLKHEKTYDVDKVEQFILQNIDRSIVGMIRGNHSEASDAIRREPRDNNRNAMNPNQGNQAEAYGNRIRVNSSMRYDAYDDQGTGLIDDAMPNRVGGSFADSYSSDYEGRTGLIGDAMPSGTGGLYTADGFSEVDGKTGLIGGVSDGSGLIGDDESTGLLSGGSSFGTGRRRMDGADGGSPQNYGQRQYPKLFRVQTRETVAVDKPVFRIGKEKSYVDYFVANNSAVSRSHADIVTRNGRYFVVDLNSLNKTYINDRMITPQRETEIFDRDRLRLGNEEFIFQL